MSLKVGDKAPPFKLYSSEKEEIALDNFAGKNLVLLFFPAAFTGVCTKELCSMRDDLSIYEELNAEIVAISVDSPFTLDKFKTELDLNFPLLSDFNKEVSEAYDTIHEEFAFGMKGVSKRSAFVIGKDGTVQYVEVLDVPTELPDFDAIKNTLSTL